MGADGVCGCEGAEESGGGVLGRMEAEERTDQGARREAQLYSSSVFRRVLVVDVAIFMYHTVRRCPHSWPATTTPLAIAARGLVRCIPPRSQKHAVLTMSDTALFDHTP